LGKRTSRWKVKGCVASIHVEWWEGKQKNSEIIPQSIGQSKEDDTVRIDEFPFCCGRKTTSLLEALRVLELLLRTGFCLF
jgi:hypothetical protein